MNSATPLPSESDLISFGSRLKYIRKTLGLKQTDLSKTMGVGNSVISEYENNRVMPTFNGLLAFSKKFKVNLNFLFHGYGRPFLSEYETGKHKSVTSISQEDIDEFMLHFSRSSYVQHTILGNFQLIKEAEESAIKKQIEKFSSS
jgi:transcriptional regulator with XRE-family HTH domain